MELNEYQRRAITTCLPESDNLMYMSWNLAGEVGELCGKLAKAMRKGELYVFTLPLDKNGKHLHSHDLRSRDEKIEELKKECGDVMWQISGLCSVLGFSLEDVCQQNLEKLANRKQRGVIDGEGDNR